MSRDYTRRYTAKMAELRKTDLRIDWSEVSALDGPRRIALWHSELLEAPFNEEQRYANGTKTAQPKGVGFAPAPIQDAH
jgi:hypothetical protein